MSAPIRPKLTPQMQQYRDDVRAYEVGVARWLGIEPESVMRLDEQKVEHPAEFGIEMPPSLKLTWEALGRNQVADEHPGRHALPYAARGVFGEPTIYTLGVHLDWFEVDRLRADVGERPEFPISPVERAALERLTATATRGS